jgi:hypothetical protein
MERVALIASLRAGTYEKAEELASDPPTESTMAGIERWSIFLSPTEVAFVFEGEDVEERTREWFDDPVRSPAISPWLAIFDSPLHVAREARAWEQGGS